MTSVTEQIRSLLAPPNAATSSGRTLSQIEQDYPSFESLSDLDALTHTLEKNKGLLTTREQDLDLSQASLDHLISTTLSKSNLVLASAQELSLTRHSLADQLASLVDDILPSTSQSNAKGKAPQSLLEELEHLHGRLSELERTRNYVRIIEHSLELSNNALVQIKESVQHSLSESSLTAYIHLQDFVSRVVEHCRPCTPEQGLHIVSYVEEIRDRTWKDIYNYLSEKLISASELLKWPTAVDLESTSNRDVLEFDNAFSQLLQLQEAGEKINIKTTPKEDGLEKHFKRDGLYPLQSLVHPISLRFKYHFEGKRQTNRSDKPEWYFTHVMNVIHEHRSFMDTHVQSLLSKSPYKNINAQMEFTRILFGLPWRKLKKTIPTILHNPSLLAHTIYQTLIFDSSVRDDGFDLNSTWEGRERKHLLSSEVSRAPSRGKKHAVPRKALDFEWEGLAGFVLGKKEWFESWLFGEKKFAEDQYNVIISSPDAWLMADEGAPDEDDISTPEARTTNSARKVKALTQGITERYQPLPHLQQKAQFIFLIQLPILESYYARISSSLDAYETLSSSFVRAVPGALAGQTGAGTDNRRLTSGVHGLTRLVKAHVSAAYMKACMEQWGEDLFFLETWHEIQANPVLRARADHTKSLPPSHISGTTLERTETTIFDELMAQYGALSARSEAMIVRQVCGEVESDLKGYFASQWDRTGQQPSESSAVTLPAMLVAPLSLISGELSFIAQSLSTPTVTSLYRQIAAGLSHFIIQRSVSHRGRNQFSAEEGKAFAEECALWVDTCRAALIVGGRSVVRRVELPWADLMDVAIVISVPGAVIEEVIQTVFEGSDEAVQDLISSMGVKNLTRDGVKRILRARQECHYS